VNDLEPEKSGSIEPEDASVVEPDDELPPSRSGGSADPWHGLDDFEND
jgi:hypothetical protein